MFVHTNAFLGKAECFCDCSTSFILFSSSSPFSSLPLLSIFFYYYYLCVWVYVLVEGRDSQTLHWWLFSWFIIIKHCNDSFIQLVVTRRWECFYASGQFSFGRFAISREERWGAFANGGNASCCCDERLCKEDDGWRPIIVHGGCLQKVPHKNVWLAKATV